MITTRPHCPPCECAECEPALPTPDNRNWRIRYAARELVAAADRAAEEARRRVDPLGLDRACAHSAITKDCPECAAADLVLRSAKEYETKFLADVEGDLAEMRKNDVARRVALTDLPNGDHVSTVLLHGSQDGDPDAYETLVTRGPHEGMSERHATRREAERAHRVMVDMLSADE